MTLGSGYLSAYFNGQAGMLFGNGYGCNVASWFGGYNSVETNVWGEVAGLFTAQALQITPSIIAACKANKQASVPTETAADYDTKISEKKSEITNALSALGLDTDFGKISDATTAADLVPESYTTAVTTTEATYNEAKGATKTAKEKRDAAYYKNQAIASATPGETYTADQIGDAKAAVAAIDQEIEAAEAAEAEAKKKYDAAVKAKNDKETAIEAKLPNIKKLIGEYNDLKNKQNGLRTSEEKTETDRINAERAKTKGLKNEDYTKVWENETAEVPKEGAKQDDLVKGYVAAAKMFQSAEGDDKNLWAKRAANILKQVPVCDIPKCYQSTVSIIQDHVKKLDKPED